ncbi:flagellar brake protein [Vibrio proteolyticus]|uniref:Cation tolerance protein CutA n=1 Tax=Vibrio proteolyticus NBRC 13287 TaxID=1219065 RepID=U2ZKJ8_VIBPR|nr:flagellar brake protein [Vibrio proteolyticus]GAD68276.1 hypothetical protein VPR01S_12_00850 [Vibrio proteolyticus NBRC 13287]
MNTQAVAKNEIQRGNKTVSTLNSTDALAMLEHGSEMTIGITTPVGTTFRCKTAFIGTHSSNLILIEIPKISDDDINFFFQEGFWLTVRAISPRGEGALVHFRSQLTHFVREPVSMVAISVPGTMQVTQLRKEPRYEVNLPGKVILGDYRSECEIRDLSKSGCRFITAPLGRTFLVGDEIAIELSANNKEQNVFAPLYGKVCNLQRSKHYSRYGLQFDEQGMTNARNLLAQLKFDGTKLTLRSS